jgi:hypothetical protein
MLVSALVALALAGCGGEGDSRKDFEEDVRGAQQEVESQLDELEDVRSQEDVPEALGNAANAFRERAEELEDADVPEDAEDEREQLVQSLRSLADDLEQNAEAAQGGVGDLLESLQDVELDALREFEDAIERLREEGFEVDGGT